MIEAILTIVHLGTARLWPARVFALPGELGAVRVRFRAAALGLTGFVSLGLVWGDRGRDVLKSGRLGTFSPVRQPKPSLRPPRAGNGGTKGPR